MFLILLGAEPLSSPEKNGEQTGLVADDPAMQRKYWVTWYQQHSSSHLTSKFAADLSSIRTHLKIVTPCQQTSCHILIWRRSFSFASKDYLWPAKMKRLKPISLLHLFISKSLLILKRMFSFSIICSVTSFCPWRSYHRWTAGVCKYK